NLFGTPEPSSSPGDISTSRTFTLHFWSRAHGSLKIYSIKQLITESRTNPKETPDSHWQQQRSRRNFQWYDDIVPLLNHWRSRERGRSAGGWGGRPCRRHPPIRPRGGARLDPEISGPTPRQPNGNQRTWTAEIRARSTDWGVERRGGREKLPTRAQLVASSRASLGQQLSPPPPPHAFLLEFCIWSGGRAELRNRGGVVMDERIPPGNYYQYSPSGIHSSPHNSMRPYSAASDRERYLAELLGERQKLAPFIQVLPFCSRLLNQEIVRASGLAPNQTFDTERIEHGSPLRFSSHSNGGLMDLEPWSGMQTEDNGVLQRMGILQASSMGWHGPSGVPASSVVKKVVRLDVPIDKFPNYNFVGRLLGPRGNSLKRVEATTQCRVYIRGRGSVKDSVKDFLLDLNINMACPSTQEDQLRDKPGYEHLNEPLHVLVEAEFPAEVIDTRLNQAVGILEDLLKPVDESLDYYKKQQLRELAMLNGTLREDSPHRSPSASPFNGTGMKRAKTGR
ncbi:hypothetical protein Taro_038308, partial [Colocasia esculenta]|nr:hypothetical protein [Colocasia esculenta]